MNGRERHGRIGTSDRTHLLAPRAREVGQREFAARHVYDPLSSIETDVSHGPHLQLRPRGLANAGGFRGPRLSQTARLSPPSQPLSDLHVYRYSDNGDSGNSLSYDRTGIAVDSLPIMGGSKSLPSEMSAHLKRELDDLIANKFRDQDGKAWSQTRIGKVLGCSQTQMSDMMAGKKFGPSALIAMSRESGKTIDELLGPTAPGFARANLHGAIVGKTLDLMNKVESRFGFANANLDIPALIKDIRTLINTAPGTELRGELKAAAERSVERAKSKSQKRRKTA